MPAPFKTAGIQGPAPSVAAGCRADDQGTGVDGYASRARGAGATGWSGRNGQARACEGAAGELRGGPV